MDDVQNRHDERGISLDKAGVKGLRYPIFVLDKEDGKQATVAQLAMSVNLPHYFKGTHMSRFIEILNNHRGEMTIRTLPLMLNELKERLDAESAHIEVIFPYFIEKEAPISGMKALMDYECTITGFSNNAVNDFSLKVKTPVTSLCPCSKEISDYGAHNQRGYITIEVKSLDDTEGKPEIIWIEDLVTISENSASAPVFPLIKRADERYVTMKAYDNPVFVEDMVREVAKRLTTDLRVKWFKVHAENEESIHNHNAFAEFEWLRKES